MKLQLENYNQQILKWPTSGNHLLAQYDENQIIVYQADRPEIGLFAAKNQYFGGAFSLDRMSWIKPNFLWMMYRSGWGTKEGQEVTLAIHLKLEAFKKYLQQGVYSSFHESQMQNHDTWKNSLNISNCRLQWDPDHDPFGNKLERRAIQIGLRNDLIKSFAQEDIIEIEDISEFISQQRQLVDSKKIDQLITPLERPLIFSQEKLNQHLKLINHEHQRT